MAGYEEANSREWPDDSQPIVRPAESYSGTGNATGSPAGGRSPDDIEDERQVPKWPYVAGALLLLAIPIVVVIILFQVF
jgi:hypothetical protein